MRKRKTYTSTCSMCLKTEINTSLGRRKRGNGVVILVKKKGYKCDEESMTGRECGGDRNARPRRGWSARWEDKHLQGDNASVRDRVQMNEESMPEEIGGDRTARPRRGWNVLWEDKQVEEDNCLTGINIVMHSVSKFSDCKMATSMSTNKHQFLSVIEWLCVFFREFLYLCCIKTTPKCVLTDN